MSGNSPSGNSWIAIECLGGLTALGICCFFFEPKYGPGLLLIVGALVQTLANVIGAKTGGKMPQQAGDAKPGQSTQSTTTSETTSPAPQ